jgi:hypothetical protein
MILKRIYSKRKLVQADITYLSNHYRKKKKKVLIFSFYTLVAIFLAFFFMGTKLFYPFHFIIALFLIALSVKFFWDGFLTFRGKLFTPNLIYRFYEVYGRWVFAITLAILLIIMINWVYPQFYSPFAGVDRAMARQILISDSNQALVLLERFEMEGKILLNHQSLLNDSLSIDDREELMRAWENLVITFKESEQLTERHRYFHKLPFSDFSRESAESFALAYSLYVRKYELFHQLMQKVNGREVIKKLLNERIEEISRDDNYSRIAGNFFEFRTFVRLNIGRAWLSIHDLLNYENRNGERYTILSANAKKSFAYLKKEKIATFIMGFRVGRDKLEENMHHTWFPLQREVSNFLGDFNYSNREEKFITLEQINTMKKELEPGDIMVQRRNWYGSNIGLPGFWPHLAIYTGTLTEMEEYFMELMPYEGHNNILDLLKNNNAQAYRIYIEPDKKGFYPSVIEGRSEGVIMQSLAISAEADYVGVLRPRLEKGDKLKAILRALVHLGKPYDYDFDFDTRDEFVCSELVYDAYESSQNKIGLTLEMQSVGGHLIWTPTDLVKKFDEEKNSGNSELEFVYFLDGSEKLGEAAVKDVDSFSATWQRAKYDWVLE